MRRALNSRQYRVPVAGFSQVVAGPGGYLFVSGITARDAGGEVLHKGDLAGQCRQVMENLKVILEDAGSSLDEVVQVRTFVRDLSQGAALERIWQEYWGETWPASTLVEVRRLVDEAQLIEIEAVAVSRSGEGG